MLFQPFITIVVLTINLSSTYAMEKQYEQNQQPTVPMAAAMNNPSDNTYQSTHQKTPFFKFGRKKTPVAPQNIYPHNQQPTVPMGAAMNHPSDSTYPPFYQSPNHANFANHQPLQRIIPPMEDPNFSYAQCGLSRYNKDEIISARAEGCRKLPFYHDNIVTRKAVEYIPADNKKYKGSSSFYLYPIGKPLPGITRTPHYGLDRIVLNQWCQAVDVLTEMPRFTEFAKKTKKYFSKRPIQYDQRNYIYKDCRLS